MNFDLKKINWEPGKEPSQLQLMTLRIRKKSDEDEENSYTTVSDSLQVYMDGTILNPPVIKDLDEETNYVLRIRNNDPEGGQFDMVFTTPRTLETEALTKSYYPDSELSYELGGDFESAMLPPRYGAYYPLEYTPSDLFSGYRDAIMPGNVVWGRKEDQLGIKLQTPADLVLIPFDSAFLLALKTRYSIGIHFYVAAEDLPATGRWPLINYNSPPGSDGVLVYVNCDTKKVHWMQSRNVVTEEIISVDTIKTDAWNQILVFRADNIAQSQLWLNGANTFTGALTAASVPNFPFLIGGVYLGSPGGLFSRFYYTTLVMDNSIAAKYQQPPYPVGILQNYYDPEDKYTIGRKNMIRISNSKIVCTLPSDVPAGRKLFYIEDSDGTRPSMDINVLPLEKKTEPVDIVFGDLDNDAESVFKDFCFPMAKAWGGANGGVSPKHVYMEDGLLILEAHGDHYTGNSQGFGEDGNPRFHDKDGDPLHNEPWTTRVGAVITSQDYYGYGSYVVNAKLPREMGVAPAFWTFNRGVVHPQDPRYEQLLAQGLQVQGSLEEGYYVVAQNEIDMELPGNNASYVFSSVEEMLYATYNTTWAGQKVAVTDDPEAENNGTWQLTDVAAPKQLTSWTKVSAEIQRLFQPRKSNIRCVNKHGELGAGNGITLYDPFNDEYYSMLTEIGKDVWDDAFHEFRFDWYANRVEFYVDGEMIQVNRQFVPDVPGRWTIGLWFPSQPDSRRSWLVDPNTAWAGPIADWKYQKMVIKRITHTPFSDEEAGGTNRLVGETYPFDGLQNYPGPLPA